MLSMPNLKNKKICVLMGGRSGERAVSLRSGKNVLNSLKSQGYNVISSDLDDDLISKLKKEQVDIVYIALHGRFGEDGVVQGMLELAGIPYTGSKVLASALAMNKLAAKRVFVAENIPTAKYLEVDASENIKEEVAKIEKQFKLPIILKPTSEGSSLGVIKIKTWEGFEKTLEQSVAEFKAVFVEEFLVGQEITVGVVGKYQDLQALPILELVTKNEFYDYEAKYTAGLTEFILPARLNPETTKKAQEIALAAHRALGCYGVSRVDMIIGQDQIPYVHEVNTIPGMTDQSDLPAEAAHLRISFDELVVRILESAY
ncbi:hypothetical protein A2291_02345 [candidate division WOR-1 bacterium RIFOXYB2_FULL_42_35]|uniref:D-alanine--D-alanine ligase n=1 Tax=candidate division WOR-1 bacterium RIFOXYC2_FULL_41_25 TaxID=1802586 RepID=A0A1F4TT09_UNCSA|nr:MAG: hypothetical protein A2247_07270 [candidate division WOR-1 bacterium RIFOXYA2_FULL_41_14]OGC25403.1 MAG: hypothetical protein A2291_02345 [candidate division WOR-1 bacterium RIFOXYB2_FULL_42_35]OGC35203.1 MAG: hypothetical protein A2462_07580 [candidate division WOR-1 bacterium RIFOXYC2_FULL_41_25]OGC42991.1 MAG: hypothetical protein A2548_04845 [candidate division WOR-1 bacterium RIFOXYD2_FULL_41_8]